jgi:hypothetical protein
MVPTAAERASRLGPRIVAVAERALTHGPAALVPEASTVLAHHIGRYHPADALTMYLCAFDRHGPEPWIVGDLLVNTWPTFAMPDGRAAILARWVDGSLRSWIEAPDVAWARAVVEADAAVRTWAEPIAIRCGRDRERLFPVELLPHLSRYLADAADAPARPVSG